MNCNTTHYRANSSSVPGDPTDVAALDLHGVDENLEKAAAAAAAVNVKRVRSRALELGAWFDAEVAETPRWIERFVEMKTIWHPSGV